MAVYILEFETPLGNERHQARYYVGYVTDGKLEGRLYYHRVGRGAAITKAAAERGIDFKVVYYEEGATRADERRIKNYKNTRACLNAKLKRQQKEQGK